MLGWARRLNLRAAHAPHRCRVTCSPKGPKLGFKYLPTYKTLHCVHGIPPSIRSQIHTIFPRLSTATDIFTHNMHTWGENHNASMSPTVHMGMLSVQWVTK